MLISYNTAYFLENKPTKNCNIERRVKEEYQIIGALVDINIEPLFPFCVVANANPLHEHQLSLMRRYIDCENFVVICFPEYAQVKCQIGNQQQQENLKMDI